jgi:hypothetical protein
VSAGKMMNPQQAFLSSMAAVSSALQQQQQNYHTPTMVRSMMPSHHTMPVEVRLAVNFTNILRADFLILQFGFVFFGKRI